MVRWIDESEIESAVQRVALALAPDVLVIRYDLGRDWTGDAAIFFRVVLSDEASNPKQLYANTRRIKDAILHEVRAHEMDLLPYFNYRSASEQRELKEETWV